MGDEEKKKSGSNIPLKPNAPYWKPQNYYKLAAYVSLFNEVVANYSEFGLTNANGDHVINNFIFDNIEALNEREGFEFIKIPEDMPKRPVKPAKRPEMTDETYESLVQDYNAAIQKYNEDFEFWKNGYKYDKVNKQWVSGTPRQMSAMSKTRAASLNKYNEAFKEFRTDKGNITGYVKDLNKAMNGSESNYISNTQMYQVLEAKKDQVKGWYEDVRKASSSKSGKKDDEGKAAHWHDWDNAQEELRDKKMVIRRNARRSFRRFVATALFSAATIASAGALLSYGGFALTAMFGTAFNATGVSGAVLGFVGTFGGGAFTKKFFGRFLDSLNEGRKLRKDKKEFLYGFAKYADETGQGKTRKAKGYYARRQRFYEDLAIKKFLESYKDFNPDDVKGSSFRKWRAKRNHAKYFGFKKSDRYLARALRRGLKRGSIINKYDNDGMPIDFAQLKKEASYFQFVNDSAADPKKKYNFHRMRAILSAQKSGNIEDVLSPQGEVLTAEAFLNGKKTKSLEEYVESAMAFESRAKDKFKNDNAVKFKQIMHNYTEAILDSVDNELFNNAYSSTLCGSVETEFTQQKVKAMFENKQYGSTSEKALNAIKFVESLEKDVFAGGVLNGDVSASIENQVFIDKKHMADACSKFGVASGYADPVNPNLMRKSPVYENIQKACENIEKIVSKSVSDDVAYKEAVKAIEYIRTDESVLPVFEGRKKTAEYLQYMLNKKLSETRHSAKSLEEEISKKYASYDANKNKVTTPVYDALEPIMKTISKIDEKTTPHDIAKIRQTIMADDVLSKDSKTQDFALSKVQDQIEAIERKRRNDVIAKVMPCIRGNKFYDFEEYMKLIPKDDDVIEPEKIYTVLSKFKKVKPVEMSEFLVLKLKDKVTSILQKSALSSKFNTSGGNFSASIDELQKFITNIGNCVSYGIIDEWQKDKCSKAIEEKIIAAFGPHLDSLERDFLKDVTKNRVLAETYLKEMKLGGFAEFLESGTPAATSLKNRLTRIFDATDLSDLMSAESKGYGFGGLVLADEGETKTSLRIYFSKERKDGDILYDVLKNMKVITRDTAGFGQSENLELVTATGPQTLSIYNPKKGDGSDNNVDTSEYMYKSYVYKMKQILNKLTSENVPGGIQNSYDGQNISAEDTLAILLVMKKRTIAMLKAQMNKFYEKNMQSGESVQNFASRSRDQIDRLREKWFDIANDIDARVEALQGQVATKYKGYKNCREIISSGANYNKYSSFMTSPELTV